MQQLVQIGPREIRRRQRELRGWIGRQIVELRAESGASRLELARCTGYDQSYLRRVELGVAQPSLDALVAIGACLGADLSMRYFAGAGPRIRDRFQAPMIDALLRVRHAAWRAVPEVPVPAARGVIDLVLTRERDRCTVACECHSELRRLELVIRRGAEKALALGPRHDGGPTPSCLLLLRSTDATRAIVRAYGPTFAAAFPGRSEAAYEALTTPDAPWPGSSILWARVTGGRAEILPRPPRGMPVGW